LISAVGVGHVPSAGPLERRLTGPSTVPRGHRFGPSIQCLALSRRQRGVASGPVGLDRSGRPIGPRSGSGIRPPAAAVHLAASRHGPKPGHQPRRDSDRRGGGPNKPKVAVWGDRPGLSATGQRLWTRPESASPSMIMAFSPMAVARGRLRPRQRPDMLLRPSSIASPTGAPTGGRLCNWWRRHMFPSTPTSAVPWPPRPVEIWDVRPALGAVDPPHTKWGLLRAFCPDYTARHGGLRQRSCLGDRPPAPRSGFSRLQDFVRGVAFSRTASSWRSASEGQDGPAGKVATAAS